MESNKNNESLWESIKRFFNVRGKKDNAPENISKSPKTKAQLYQALQKEYQPQSPMSVKTGGLLK